jgi:hypothetical protein
MKLPWTKKKEEQPQNKKRFVGLSNRASPVDKMVSDVKQLPVSKPKITLGDANLLKPLQPYLTVVADDIKRIFHRDERSERMKQEHDDFMEHFFGGNK